MNRKARRAGESAFGMVEVLAIVAVVIVLGIVFMPTVAGCGGKSPRIRCVSNLKNVGLAFRIFATDNNDKFPGAIMISNGMDVAAIDILSVYKSISNELSTPRLLHCTTDTKRTVAKDFSDFTSDDISYFASLSADETMPQVFLAGDRNLEVDGKAVKRGVLALTTNLAVGWTKEMHNRQGNVVMGDGSVQQMSSSRLLQSTRDQGLTTNYLAVP